MSDPASSALAARVRALFRVNPAAIAAYKARVAARRTYRRELLGPRLAAAMPTP